MKTEKMTSTNIDGYISKFPADIQEILEELRVTIRNAAPEADERISYQIPTYTLKGNLVHFAAFKNHIGFYPGSTGIEKFRKNLSVYKGAEGSVQFPLGNPLPLGLITKIVRFRVKENLEREIQKQKRKK